ncbi:MAG: tetratricopeptide repeat protein [Bacteroidetes bacterium]|nr:MAG: tetratricopeptide repeat protein [Bacteroidota bacterium]
MKLKILLLLLGLSLTVSGWSQESTFQHTLAQARHMAETGQYKQAELLYDQLLRQEPDNLQALVGAGYNYSWSKDYDKARLKFERALSLDARNAEALIGQGYNNAWAGKYEVAKHSFEALRTADPENPEGLKGLGYVHLWAGQPAAAETYFMTLTRNYPDEVEYRIALAQVYLAKHELKNARIALQSALQLDSSNRTANELMKRTKGMAAPLELDIWGGYSNTEGESKFSLRTLQLTGQVSQKVRMYLKYDNSLTTDLAALVRASQDAQALSLGTAIGWNKHLTSRLEFGARLLPDNVTQQLVNGEQVFFFENGMLLKGGGFYGWSDKVADEWLAYAGFRVPVTNWYAVEPYYFRSQVENAPGPEGRFMLNNQFRSPNGYELNLGLFYGKAAVTDSASEDRIMGSYATAILPLSQVIWGQISVRWEETPFADLTVVAAGIKIRLEK